MTREELKFYASEAGKIFISKIDKGTYLPRWFDSQTLIADGIVCELVDMIDYYNTEIKRWVGSGFRDEDYREHSHAYYFALEGMLHILRAIGYYKPSEYGDINPLIDYCWSCWRTKQPIDFAEYEKIRAFFEEGEEG